MVNGLVRQFGGPAGAQRVALALVGLGTVSLILVLAHWATRPDWILLMQGGGPDEVGQVAERLEAEGIPYRLEGRGSGISVPEGELARARVALARSGTPVSGRPGFELFDQPSWGMTDFTQRINFRRALEGELERTISRMRGVESSQVHLGLQESAVLRRTGAGAEASVVVRLRTGVAAEPSLASGIASLVAGSVDGLEPAKVRVLDDTGRLLSDTEESGSPTGATDRQLSLRREVEHYLEQKAEALLVPVVGADNVSVRVAVELDFDRVERTTRLVDGDTQATLQADRSEVIPGTEEQGAAQIITSTTFEPSRSVESIAREGARIQRMTVAVLVGHRETLSEEGAVVAVPREADEMAWIEALVAQAVGLLPERGDGMTVTNLPFLGPAPGERGGIEAAPQPLDIPGWVEQLRRPLVGLVALLLIFLFGRTALRSLARVPDSIGSGDPAWGSELQERSGASGGDRGEPASLPARGSGGGAESPAPASAPRPPPAAMAIRDPETTSRLVRAWMKET